MGTRRPNASDYYTQRAYAEGRPQFPTRYRMDNAIAPSAQSYFTEEQLHRISEEMMKLKSIERVASKLGLPYGVVQRATTVLKERWRERSAASTEDWVDEQLARIDALEEALWTNAKNGNVQAIDRILHLWDQRNKLKGLYAPSRVDITNRIRQMATEHGLDPEEAVREAERLIGQGIGS